MASYSSSGVQVSWNVRALPGMGGASLFPPVFVLVWSVAVVLVVVSPWCAVVSRVAATLVLFMSGARMRRATVSLWAWSAWSSSVST